MIKTHVILSGNFRWVKLFVIRSAGRDVEPSTADSSKENRVVDLELDHAVQRLLLLLKHRIELKIVMKTSMVTVRLLN
jgi:hypothetical protein